MNDKILFETENKFVKFWVYEDFCDIEYKRNLWSFFISGKFFSGRKRIYYKDVTAIQMRPVGMIFSGYLKFEYAGAPIFSHFMSLFSDSTITFKSTHSSQMELIYEYIDNRIRMCKCSGTPSYRGDNANFSENSDEFNNYMEELKESTQKKIAEEFEIKKQAEAQKAAKLKEMLNDEAFVAKFRKLNKKLLTFSIIWLCAFVLPLSIILGIAGIVLTAFGVGVFILLELAINLIMIIVLAAINIYTYCITMKNVEKSISSMKISAIVNIIAILPPVFVLLPFSGISAIFFLIMWIIKKKATPKI